MKRLEILAIASLAGLAGFVAVEARGARQHATELGGVETSLSSGTSAARVLASTDGLDAIPTVSPSAKRDVEDIRRRLRAGASGTYIEELLRARDSALARWPDRRTTPLRVWVQPASDIPHFQSSFAQLVREAFDSWSGTGIPVGFSFVRDSASADVHVTWIDRFNEMISGKTLWAHDDDWWIVEANIVLAVHHSGGEALDTSAVRAIALHEVGHLIGLDHTADTANIMTAKVRVKELSVADRATARLLYSVPPGGVK